MQKKERYSRILAWFEENQPMPETELHYDSPFHLLISVILSAQCTDRRVNMVVPPLFERYPRPEDLAAASFDDVFSYVRSVSYPNSKTRHLIAMAGKLVSEYGSEVPSDIDSLMSLPGVGRKTANVVLAEGFGQHVARRTLVFPQRLAQGMGFADLPGTRHHLEKAPLLPDAFRYASDEGPFVCFCIFH